MTSTGVSFVYRGVCCLLTSVLAKNENNGGVSVCRCSLYIRGVEIEEGVKASSCWGLDPGQLWV